MAGQGCRDADGGLGGRTEGGSRARAQTQGSEEIEGETTGGKADQARVSATRTGTKRPDARRAVHPGGRDPWGRDTARTRGDRRVAQTDLCGSQANQELGQEEQTEGGNQTIPHKQAGACLRACAKAGSECRTQADEEAALPQTSQACPKEGASIARTGSQTPACEAGARRTQARTRRAPRTKAAGTRRAPTGARTQTGAPSACTRRT